MYSNIKNHTRHISYAIQKGAKVSAVVNDTKRQPSPLLQGGLKILIRMNVAWDHKSNIRILQEKVSCINLFHVQDLALFDFTILVFILYSITSFYIYMHIHMRNKLIYLSS